ncbi:MAG: transporter [Planctomycetota bacterium]|nr:transporter [Planctomycetota bacterium]
MLTRFQIAILPMLIAAGNSSLIAQDAAEFSDLVSWSDASRVAEIVRGNDSSPGTLFRWSNSPALTGGPDLNEPLVTDRPDFTEASSTVGQGVAQIEFGWTYTYDSDGTTSVRNHSFGEPLLRYGILENWLEFRLAVFPVNQRTNTAGGSASTSGTEDIYLGFKLGLTPQDGVLPEMSMIPQMTVPTGSSSFSSNRTLPGLNLIYAWDLNEDISTAGSTQFNQSVDEGTGRTYTEWAQSWTIAYTLTDELGAYTEWYGLFPTSADTAQTEHYFNGGFTYLLSDDVQFDIRAGVGLNDAAADYFIGTGLSIRFP